jgi:hypothetical protein
MHTNGEPASTIAETLGVSRQTHTVFAAWRRRLTATATIEPVEKPRTTDSLRAVLDATCSKRLFLSGAKYLGTSEFSMTTRGFRPFPVPSR